jgi:hypothetical protein
MNSPKKPRNRGAFFMLPNFKNGNIHVIEP